MGLDDVGLLALACSFISIAVLLMTDYTALSSQTDTTLATMAAAVGQMQTHVQALTAPNADQATVDALAARLKAGTDQLAAAIAAAQAA